MSAASPGFVPADATPTAHVALQHSGASARCRRRHGSPVVVVRQAKPERIPARQFAPHAVFAGAVPFMLLYLVGVVQGAVSLIGGNFLHELFVEPAQPFRG
jgi:hypothetical protein